MTRRSWSCALGIAALGLLVGAEHAGASEGDIARLLTEYHQAGHFSGAVKVVRDGQTLYRGGLGYSDESFCTPASADHRFQIGSISKQFTAALALRLSDQGRLDLDRPIAHYLPDYASDLTADTTVHRLLTHTAGVADVSDPELFREMVTTPLSTSDGLHRFCRGERLFDPGDGWSYSNCGYQLAGAVIERASGRTFRDALRELLAAAGLRDTGPVDHREIVPRMARGYVFEASRWRRMPHYDWTNSLASGGLYSTVDDLHRWQEALLESGLLLPASRERLLTVERMDYAYGWYVGEGAVDQVAELLSSIRTAPVEPAGDALRLAMHSGDLAGFHTILIRLFKPDAVVVVLDNHDVTGIYDHRRITRLASDLVRLLVGAAPEGPATSYGPAHVPSGLRAAMPCPR